MPRLPLRFLTPANLLGQLRLFLRQVLFGALLGLLLLQQRKLGLLFGLLFSLALAPDVLMPRPLELSAASGDPVELERLVTRPLVQLGQPATHPSPSSERR